MRSTGLWLFQPAPTGARARGRTDGIKPAGWLADDPVGVHAEQGRRPVTMAVRVVQIHTARAPFRLQPQATYGNEVMSSPSLGP
jgi:hypothetical protein